MTHTYIKKEFMVLCEDVYQNMSNKKYRENAMEVLMEDIMLEIELHKRFYNQVFIGQPLLKMLEGMFYLAMNVKELVIFLNVMKCL
jgi:hypothetical protein